MTGDCHVPFCGGLGVRFPWATRLVVIVNGNKAHAEAIRAQCQRFLEGELKLTLTNLS